MLLLFQKYIVENVVIDMKVVETQKSINVAAKTMKRETSAIDWHMFSVSFSVVVHLCLFIK